jgi:polysaccharide biosynthesis/export protein
MRVGGVVVVALGLAGCPSPLESLGGETALEIPYDPPASRIGFAPFDDLLTPPPTEAAAALREGDLLEVTIHGHADLTHRARVPRDGMVSLPYVGDVALGGLTLAASRERIRAAYERDYLVAAPCSILVVERAPRKVFVLGAVANPGAYDIPLESELTLLRAIAHAGGMREESERDGIMLLRTGAEGRTRVYRLSYTAVAGEGQLSGDVRLLPNDTLVVPDRGKVTVLGAVNAAGVFPIPREGMTLTRAIALARGMTRFASANNTVVTRPRTGEAARSYRVPLGDILAGRFTKNPVLYAGDVVFVHESIF